MEVKREIIYNKDKYLLFLLQIKTLNTIVILINIPFIYISCVYTFTPSLLLPSLYNNRTHTEKTNKCLRVWTMGEIKSKHYHVVVKYTYIISTGMKNFII